MISNPPYGRDWETDENEVKAEAELGYNGRFGAGLPRKSDGQLLFIQHMISKMKTNDKSKIAVITNGSPLFTGDAGSGSRGPLGKDGHHDGDLHHTARRAAVHEQLTAKRYEAR